MIYYRIYNTVNELPKAWDSLPTNDNFLKSSFLTGLENSCPSNITSFYVGVFKDEDLVGIAIIQRVQMYLDDIFRRTSNNKLKQIGKQLVSKIIKGNALIVGNLMHTGQHGLYFNTLEISISDYLNNIHKAIQDLTVEIKQRFNKKIRIIAFKDYFENDAVHECSAFFDSHNLYKVQVQPNMVFSILNTWKTQEDYIGAFNKKYRRRYRTARKKSTELTCKELDVDFIKNHADVIFKLYENVSDNARVNSFKLSEDHFYSLKANLKDNFKVFGYFFNQELVGFYSIILNEGILETYFLGYRQELQHKYQMYLNMLFDMAFYGVENGFKTIVYARTAMEIKSSIGAEAHKMYIYLKHTNNFVANTILKLVVKYMNPIRKWEQRHPFKV